MFGLKGPKDSLESKQKLQTIKSEMKSKEKRVCLHKEIILSKNGRRYSFRTIWACDAVQQRKAELRRESEKFSEAEEGAQNRSRKL